MERILDLGSAQISPRNCLERNRGHGTYSRLSICQVSAQLVGLFPCHELIHGLPHVKKYWKGDNCDRTRD